MCKLGSWDPWPDISTSDMPIKIMFDYFNSEKTITASLSQNLTACSGGQRRCEATSVRRLTPLPMPDMAEKERGGWEETKQETRTRVFDHPEFFFSSLTFYNRRGDRPRHTNGGNFGTRRAVCVSRGL